MHLIIDSNLIWSNITITLFTFVVASTKYLSRQSISQLYKFVEQVYIVKRLESVGVKYVDRSSNVAPQPLQLSETLDELLGAMCEEDPLKRVALLHVLEVMYGPVQKLHLCCYF